MSEFEFPTNIKQIGSIDEGTRIYIEDYAHSYLQQFAEAGGYEERLGFLVGRRLIIDGQPVLFVSGAVQGIYTAIEKDIITFTDKSWVYAKEQMKKYFKGLDIVGWVQSQPGYGVFLNPSYENYHKAIFENKEQVAFIMDPIEKINAFYVHSKDSEHLNESKGYFIYYDKNRGMHEYMLEHRVTKLRTATPPAKHKKSDTSVVDLDKPANVSRGKIGAGNVRQTSRSQNEPKRLVNMLVGLSAVLFLVCFIMGAGLIQSDGRITAMENQLTYLNTAYRDLLVKFEDTKTASVFATTDQDAQDNSSNDEEAAVITEDGNKVLEEYAVASSGQTQPTSEANTPAPTPQATPAPEQAQAPTEEITTASETTADNNQIPDTYTVQKGDNLGYISMKFYGTQSMVDEIMEANDMEDPNKIYFGKVLILPEPS